MHFSRGRMLPLRCEMAVISSDPWGRARNWAIGPLAAVTGLLFFSLGHEVSLLFLALSSLALLALSAKAWRESERS